MAARVTSICKDQDVTGLRPTVASQDDPFLRIFLHGRSSPPARLNEQSNSPEKAPPLRGRMAQTGEHCILSKLLAEAGH